MERLDFFGCRESGRPLWQRDDVLSFSSPVLEADVEVWGSVNSIEGWQMLFQ